MSSRYSVKSPGRGGRREGAGRKPETDQQKLERHLRQQGLEAGAGDATEMMASLIGLSPRVAALRPELTDRFEVVEPGEHLAAFSRTFCRYNQLGEVAEGGPVLGDPVEFEDFELEFFSEALSCDDRGRRVYKRAGEIIGRKNRKTTKAAILSLYLGGPADGEHRPLVVQAAGVFDQAAKLYDTTKAFIDDPLYGSDDLARLFVPMQTKILCPAVAGEIRRVAGDGDNNMSLDPHAVVMDEMHTWKTPKQRENLKALTTAQGGRLDPFVLFITTEGDGDDNELALLMERIESSEATEREDRRPGLTIFRNRESGLLVYRYAAPPTVLEDGAPRATSLADVETIKLANPAPWRTIERLQEDLADPMNDAPTKMRLFGNIRSQGANRWISNEKWAECYLFGSSPDDDEFIPAGAPVAIGVDGARTRDTTAVAWAYVDADERCRVRCRVWTTREKVEHHVLVPGGRLDNDDARDFIQDVLMRDFTSRLLFFDERYFGDQARELSEAGMTAVEMYQGKPEMQEAWDDFYASIHEGPVPMFAHDGCPVLAAHVKAAVGLKTERGWKVSKKPTGGTRSSMHADKPIDALAATVMARYAAVKFADYMPKRSAVVSWG